MENLHYEFNNLNISKEQKFGIDDVITQLEDLTLKYLNQLKNVADNAEYSYRKGLITAHPESFMNTAFDNAQNALVVARNMKKAGVENLILDTTRSLTEQVAVKAKEMGVSKQVHHYKPSF